MAMPQPGIFQRRLDEPTLTIEAKFWPALRFHVEPCDFPSTLKGWYRFVRENWVLSEETDDSKAQVLNNVDP
ncbi:hypothetical protein N7454_000812 [Penicillium verhagenii]|nr:hypothetical protein N7454_000812 [Penicillium verhagenii]